MSVCVVCGNQFDLTEASENKREDTCSRSCSLSLAWRSRDRRPIAERFVNKILIGNDCWEWTGRKDKDGYGRTRYNVKPYRSCRASKMSYELFIGPFPEGMQACHKCDNPSCVRPSHIFPGTQSDNMRDAVAKNRKQGVRGENNYHAKLTDKQVVEIKGLIKEGVRVHLIAQRFNVSDSAIWNIKYGKRWVYGSPSVSA